MEYTLDKRRKYYFIVDIMVVVIFALAFIFVIGLFAAASKGWWAFADRVHTFPVASVVNCCADMCGIIVGAVIYFDLAFAAKYKTAETRIFMAMIVVITYNLVCDSVAWSVEGMAMFKWTSFIVD